VSERLYPKVVEWSEEDQCFVGACAGLLRVGCHGDDEQAVFAELCEIVRETITLYEQDGTPLPPPIVASWRETALSVSTH